MGKKVILLIISVIAIESSYAYIDPGTGGMILNSVSPWIAGILAAVIAFFAKYFYKPTKKFFVSAYNKIFKKENEK